MEPEQQPQFEGLGDIDLLRLMARGDSFALGAWEEFFERHKGYLYGVCKRAFTHVVGEHKIEDIVQDALVRAFQKADTLQNERNLDADDQRRLVRAWLGTLCENIVRDYFRGQPEVDFVDEDVLDAYESCGSSQVEDHLADKDGSQPATRLQLMEEALQTLTEREQEVLRTTGMWYKAGQKAQRLPNHIMTELTTSLKTNPGNIRKIRERGIAKIKSYIETHEGSTEG
jgi:RNA polymerase sigma factor (sigma-70 family)